MAFLYRKIVLVMILRFWYNKKNRLKYVKYEHMEPRAHRPFKYEMSIVWQTLFFTLLPKRKEKRRKFSPSSLLYQNKPRKYTLAAFFSVNPTDPRIQKSVGTTTGRKKVKINDCSLANHTKIIVRMEHNLNTFIYAWNPNRENGVEAWR